MGLDEALLHSLDAPPTLRLYRWQPAGLSIGYFQSSADFADRPAEAVLVRRLTGGGAIFHDAELTFSLTLPSDCLPADIAESYQLIHAAVAQALASVGVTTSFADPEQDHCAGSHATRPDAPWCFAYPTPQDLLSHSGRKILGSAQRRIRRPRERVLHHGSLVLTAPAATPFCGSVEESVDPAAAATPLADAVVTELARALALRPAAAEPTSAEMQQAERLAVQRYANDAFTHRR